MKILRKPFNTLLAGLLALLPLALTVAAAIWVGNLLHRLAGPESMIGHLLVSLGMTVSAEKIYAYLAGFVMVLVGVYLIGLVVQSSLRNRLTVLADRFMRRLPLIGSLYDLTNRFVGIFDRRDQSDLKTMSPVWCFFGGEGGTAVLALLPSSEAIVLDGHRYYAVLIPTAPIPFGGALIYVPADWVKPAGFGVEKLTSVYVSMGVSGPQP